MNILQQPNHFVDDVDVAGISALSLDPNPIFPKCQDLAPDIESHDNDAHNEQTLQSYVSLNSLDSYGWSKKNIVSDETIPQSCWNQFVQLLTPVLFQCSISLATGVFTVPKLYTQVGLIPGTILLFCFGIMSYYAQCLCIDCTVINTRLTCIPIIHDHASLTKHVFYEHNSKCIIKFVQTIIALCLVFALFVTNCVHIENAATLIHDVIEYFLTHHIGNYPFTNVKYAITYSIMLLCTLRYIFARDLHKLTKLGVISTVVVLTTCICLNVVLIVNEGKVDNLKKRDVDLGYILGYKQIIDSKFWFKDVWISSFDFASMFMGSLFLFPIYNKMLDRNVVQTKHAVLISTIITILCLLCVSIVVVFIFGKNTPDNILCHVISMFSFC